MKQIELSTKLMLVFVLTGVMAGNAAMAGSETVCSNDGVSCQENTKNLVQEKKLGFTYDLTYHTKWMSKGYSVYSEHGAFFNTLAVDLWQTGFGIAARYDIPSASGHVKKERLDYTVYYGKTFFEDDSCATRCKLSWTYKDYPREHDTKINFQEWMLSMCMPRILGNTLYPKYTAFYGYPAGSDYDNAHKAGWVHSFGFCYDWKIAALNGQKAQLEAMATYNDGLGAKGHAWSHATIGTTTKFKLNKSLTITPGIYYQMAMNGMVIPTEDVLYAKISLRYNF